MRRKTGILTAAALVGVAACGHFASAVPETRYYDFVERKCSNPAGAAHDNIWNDVFGAANMIGPPLLSTTALYNYGMDAIAYDTTTNGNPVYPTNLRIKVTNNNPPGGVVGFSNSAAISQTPLIYRYFASVGRGNYYSAAYQVTNFQHVINNEYRITFTGYWNATLGTISPYNFVVTKPADGTSITDWPLVGPSGNMQPGIQGTVHANTPGPIQDVVVAIQRMSDGKFWDNADGSNTSNCSLQQTTKGWYRPMAWLSTSLRNDPNVTGQQIWERIGSVPRPANGDFPNGDYKLWCLTRDIGNRGTLYISTFHKV